MQTECGSFDAYLWAWVGGTPYRDARDRARAISGDARRSRGDQQGPQEARLHLRRADDRLRLLQSTGVVNDHVPECFRSAELT